MLIAEIPPEQRIYSHMSEETKQTSSEANGSEAQDKQTTSVNVEIKAETTEEKKEADRPGVCCGSCS